MKEIHCIKRKMYRKLKISKILYIFDKTLALSIICGKCGSNDEKIFKQENIQLLQREKMEKEFR